MNQQPPIYMASKCKHAPIWRKLRDEVGMNIISTWIDEAEEGQTTDHKDLWTRCLNEAASCKYLVVYRQPDEILKGAWIEVGAALSSNVPVLAVGCEEFTIGKSGFLDHYPTLYHALVDAYRHTYEPMPWGNKSISAPQVHDLMWKLKKHDIGAV